MRTHRIIASVTGSLALIGALSLTTPATAATPAAAAAMAECPTGEFCAWTDADFRGQRLNWSGDDGFWEGTIADNDSSWANHGVSGPGVPDHVKVFAGPAQLGGITICLAPGQEVASNADANDRGNSHTWDADC